MRIFEWFNKHILQIAGLALLVSIFTLVVWQFYPYNPVHFQGDHLRTNKLEYKAGETVTVTAHFIKYNSEAPVFVSRWFENSIVVALPSTIILVKKGENYVRVNYNIPDFFDGGTYKVCEVIMYRVNPIRVIEYRNCSNDFKIIAV